MNRKKETDRTREEKGYRRERESVCEEQNDIRYGRWRRNRMNLR